MIVAKSAGTLPSPKSISAGIRYTKLGMVCMPSKMGFKICSKRSLLAMAIPSGIPMASEMITEATTKERVIIPNSQKPSAPMKNRHSPHEQAGPTISPSPAMPARPPRSPEQARAPTGKTSRYIS